jgi:TRAP-type C4-dicarboxylate transport system permease small subunit
MPGMRLLDLYDGLVRLLVRIASFFTLLIAFFITAAMILGVFFRFVLNSSLVWTDEVSALLLAVMMFLVVGIGMHERLHIAVGVIFDRLPLAGQRALDVFLQAGCAVFFAVVGYYGLTVAESAMSMQLAMVPLPRGLFQMAMPIGGGFTVLVCINNIIRTLRGEIPRIGGID